MKGRMSLQLTSNHLLNECSGARVTPHKFQHRVQLYLPHARGWLTLDARFDGERTKLLHGLCHLVAGPAVPCDFHKLVQLWQGLLECLVIALGAPAIIVCLAFQLMDKLGHLLLCKHFLVKEVGQIHIQHQIANLVQKFLLVANLQALHAHGIILIVLVNHRKATAFGKTNGPIISGDVMPAFGGAKVKSAQVCDMGVCYGNSTHTYWNKPTKTYKLKTLW